MRLFAVRLPDGSLVNTYFGNKQQAKAVRDQHPGSCVVLGPDHKRFNNTTTTS